MVSPGPGGQAVTSPTRSSCPAPAKAVHEIPLEAELGFIRKMLPQAAAAAAGVRSGWPCGPGWRVDRFEPCDLVPWSRFTKVAVTVSPTAVNGTTICPEPFGSRLRPCGLPARRFPGLFVVGLDRSRHAMPEFHIARFSGMAGNVEEPKERRRLLCERGAYIGLFVRLLRNGALFGFSECFFAFVPARLGLFRKRRVVLGSSRALPDSFLEHRGS